MTRIWDLFALLVRAERARPGGGELVVCAACNAEAVVPVDWEDEGDGWCEVALRCGACGGRREVMLDYDEADEYDRALERGAYRIARTARELESQRMLADIDTLCVALERDLIAADDFSATRHPS